MFPQNIKNKELKQKRHEHQKQDRKYFSHAVISESLKLLPVEKMGRMAEVYIHAAAS